jgi:carbon-monoxide dehydrogenase medium subunit
VLRPFALHRPGSLEEACALLAELGDDAVPYAGGTELLLLMKEGLARPAHLVDVKRIPGLDAITADDARLVIGATVTHRALELSASVRSRCPVLTSVARHIANVRVRNVGTVGGNLAFADPHSDLATLFLALDAEVELVSPRGRRVLPVGDFVRGPWDTARVADELVRSVHVRPAERTAASYVKFGIHERPTLGIAVVLRLDAGADRRTRVADARIAVGCVNPRPERVIDAEARLRECDVADLDDAAAEVGELAAAAADPSDDLHGSADYKREMVAVFTRRAMRIAAARARGADTRPAYPYAVVA